MPGWPARPFSAAGCSHRRCLRPATSPSTARPSVSIGPSAGAPCLRAARLPPRVHPAAVRPDFRRRRCRRSASATAGRAFCSGDRPTSRCAAPRTARAFAPRRARPGPGRDRNISPGCAAGRTAGAAGSSSICRTWKRCIRAGILAGSRTPTFSTSGAAAHSLPPPDRHMSTARRRAASAISPSRSDA